MSRVALLRPGRGLICFALILGSTLAIADVSLDSDAMGAMRARFGYSAGTAPVATISGPGRDHFTSGTPG